MPWLNWSESLKKRACRYLLQRYLGQYLQEKLTLDQLSVDLYNGTGSVKDLTLDVEALNEMSEMNNLPIEFVEGYIQSVFVSIPWSSLLNESSFVEVQGLMITIQPKQRSSNGQKGVLMTTSMQLARECLANDDSKDSNKEPERVVEGLEIFAQTIDSVLRRIKVRFRDTTFRLEHVPKGSKTGTALQIIVKKIDYFDEAGTESANSVEEGRNVSEPPAFANKTFHWEGITLYSDEFYSSSSSSFSKSSLYMESDSKVTEPYSTAPETPEPILKSSVFETCFNGEDSSAYSSIRQSSLSNLSTASEPIIIAKLTGQHEIRLKLKQCDLIPGPNLLAEINLGSVVSFLSPRQLHVLTELMDGFISPNSVNENRIIHHSSASKPMKASDYERVEKELQKQMSAVNRDRSMQHHQGWSSQCLEDSDEEFLPMTGGSSRKMSNSVLSVSSASGDSASSPLVYGGKTQRQVQGTGHSAGDDAVVEATQFKLQLSSLVVIILHDDILTPAASTNGMVVHSSVLQMKSRAESFFNDLGNFCVPGNTDRSLEDCHLQLNSACKTNHLRFIGAPGMVEILSKTSNNTQNLDSTLTFGNAELVECLFEDVPTSSQASGPTYCFLLKFDQKNQPMSKSCSNYYSLSLAQPSIKIKINYEEKCHSPGQRTRSEASPKTEIDIQLTPCTCEIDISIVDRITNLLNPRDIYGKPTPAVTRANGHIYFSQVMTDSSNQPGHRLDINFSSSSLILKLRFPIPDLRPLADMNRAPWWKQTIRKDALMLELIEARLHTAFNQDNTCYSVEARCKELRGSFQENPNDPTIQFLRAYAGNGSDHTSNDELGWPRLSLKIKSPNTQSILEEPEKDDDSNGGFANSSIETLVYQLCNTDKSVEPSPFSTRKIIYESDKCSGNDQGSRVTDDSSEEEQVLPGDRKEVTEFMEYSNSNCRYIVDVSVENLKMFFPSKHFYEVVYNRITMDLLLWVPAAINPSSCKETVNFFSAPNALNWANSYAVENGILDHGFQAFSMGKSAVKDDFGSDSDDEPNPSYYSFYEHKQKQKKSHDAKSKRNRQQNKMSFTINSKHACVEFNSPLRDSGNNVVPEYEGRLQLLATDCCFYTLATPDGSPVTAYMCLHANNAEFYHRGCVPTSQLDPYSRLMDDTKNKDNLILHMTESKGKTKPSAPVGIGGDSADVLALAVRACLDQDRNVKTYRVALAIRGVTLRYHMTPKQESWFSQILDFFDVVDYPITGYEAPKIMTELHLHTWDCSVDYRPLYLPLRVMLTMESFSVSSNIAAQTKSSVVRVITEDACLFLSKYCSTSAVNLERDYVCVMDMSLFELLLRFSDDKDPQKPKIDLQAFNNMLHIRTCVDSCLALQDLLRYLASDGDLRVADQDLDDDDTYSDGLTTLTYDVNNHVVGTLMEEAMRESLSITPESNESIEPCLETAKPCGGDMFLFPGESDVQSQLQMSRIYPSLNSEPPSCMYESDESSNDSFGDFCILENDPGVGIMPLKSGEPLIRTLSPDPIRVVENHFSIPTGRTDELKAPKHFPPAVIRYTLREISLIWHMYGGNDFPESNSNADERFSKVRVRQSSGNESDERESLRLDSLSRNHVREHFREPKNVEVSFSKAKHEIKWNCGNSSSNRPSVYGFNQTNWIGKGGPGRQHNVLMELQMNKVRFQHESYAESASQASRQVLLIHDFELRDRLASSQFNKFLYQYSSENMPRQSHANMLMIKAVHRRSDPANSTQECDLKVSLLPLRLNIDQDALIFLSEFFGSLSSSKDEDGESDRADVRCSKNVSAHQAPVMSVGSNVMISSKEEPLKSPVNDINLESQNYLIQFDDTKPNLFSHMDDMRRDSRSESNDSSSTTSTIPSPIFFSSFEFLYDVPIRLDYLGKRVSMEQGAVAGLLMGLGQLNCSELCLKRLSHRGVLGVDRLVNDVINEWLQDIKQTQLPSLLGGVGPLYSIVQLFTGVRNLFWLPIEQYRKDGRIVRGLQRGANAFTTSTAMAVLQLTNRLVEAVQCTAETAYDVVSPGPSVRARRESKGSKIMMRKPCQPADIMEGVTNAYHVVREGLGDTAMTLVRVASLEHEQKGISGAVGGVLRQIPSTIVKPIILATEATSNVLGGMKHQLAPDVRKEAAQKWRVED